MDQHQSEESCKTLALNLQLDSNNHFFLTEQVADEDSFLVKQSSSSLVIEMQKSANSVTPRKSSLNKNNSKKKG